VGRYRWMHREKSESGGNEGERGVTDLMALNESRRKEGNNKRTKREIRAVRGSERALR
jgi:hypothetical protein